MQNLMGILKQEGASHRLARTPTLLLCRRGEPWLARMNVAKDDAQFFNYLLAFTEMKLSKLELNAILSKLEEKISSETLLQI